jgi:hypothetical protein
MFVNARASLGKNTEITIWVKQCADRADDENRRLSCGRAVSPRRLGRTGSRRKMQ